MSRIEYESKIIMDQVEMETGFNFLYSTICQNRRVSGFMVVGFLGFVGFLFLFAKLREVFFVGKRFILCSEKYLYKYIYLS